MSEKMRFKSYITPEILVICWGVSLIIGIPFIITALVQAVGLQFNAPWMMNSTVTMWEATFRIGGACLVLLGIRIWLEFLAIVFSIHDRLLDLATILERRPSSPQPMPASFPIGTRNPLYSSRKKS